MSKERSFIPKLEEHAFSDEGQETMFPHNYYPPQFADIRINRPVFGFGDMTHHTEEIKVVRFLSTAELSRPPGEDSG